MPLKGDFTKERNPLYLCFFKIPEMYFEFSRDTLCNSYPKAGVNR